MKRRRTMKNNSVKVIATGEGLVLEVEKRNSHYDEENKALKYNYSYLLDNSKIIQDLAQNAKLSNPSPSFNDLVDSYACTEASPSPREHSEVTHSLRAKILALQSFNSLSPTFLSNKIGISSTKLCNFLGGSDLLEEEELLNLQEYILNIMGEMSANEIVGCFYGNSENGIGNMSQYRLKKSGISVDSPPLCVIFNNKPQTNTYSPPASPFFNLIHIPLKIEWKGYKISDEFLWEKNQQDVYQMKCFALQLLNDIIGNQVNKFSSNSIESFCDTVAFVISQEIMIYEMLQPQNLVKSGILGNGFGLENEHLIRINLNIEDDKCSLTDSFDWDISNPNNNPEEFAEILVTENNLPLNYINKIGFWIRREIHDYVIKSYGNLIKNLNKCEGFGMRKKLNQKISDNSLKILNHLNLEYNWNETPTLVTNSLTEELGPLLPFKNSSLLEKHHKPKFLKNKFKTKESAPKTTRILSKRKLEKEKRKLQQNNYEQQQLLEPKYTGKYGYAHINQLNAATTSAYPQAAQKIRQRQALTFEPKAPYKPSSSSLAVEKGKPELEEWKAPLDKGKVKTEGSDNTEEKASGQRKDPLSTRRNMRIKTKTTNPLLLSIPTPSEFTNPKVNKHANMKVKEESTHTPLPQFKLLNQPTLIGKAEAIGEEVNENDGARETQDKICESVDKGGMKEELQEDTKEFVRKLRSHTQKKPISAVEDQDQEFEASPVVILPGNIENPQQGSPQEMSQNLKKESSEVDMISENLKKKSGKKKNKKRKKPDVDSKKNDPFDLRGEKHHIAEELKKKSEGFCNDEKKQKTQKQQSINIIFNTKYSSVEIMNDEEVGRLKNRIIRSKKQRTENSESSKPVSSVSSKKLRVGKKKQKANGKKLRTGQSAGSWKGKRSIRLNGHEDRGGTKNGNGQTLEVRDDFMTNSKYSLNRRCKESTEQYNDSVGKGNDGCCEDSVMEDEEEVEQIPDLDYHSYSNPNHVREQNGEEEQLQQEQEIQMEEEEEEEDEEEEEEEGDYEEQNEGNEGHPIMGNGFLLHKADAPPTKISIDIKQLLFDHLPNHKNTHINSNTQIIKSHDSH